MTDVPFSFSDIAFVSWQQCFNSLIVNTDFFNTGCLYYVMVVNYEKLHGKFWHNLCKMCPV